MQDQADDQPRAKACGDPAETRTGTLLLLGAVLSAALGLQLWLDRPEPAARALLRAVRTATGIQLSWRSLHGEWSDGEVIELFGADALQGSAFGRPGAALRGDARPLGAWPARAGRASLAVTEGDPGSTAQLFFRLRGAGVTWQSGPLSVEPSP